MKVTLLAVMSLDGKLTRGNDSKIHSWTSPEDLAHYKKVLGSTPVIMGRKTYEAMHPNLHTGQLFVVLTRSPLKYKNLSVEGRLEFTDEPPADLIKRLEKEGHDSVVLNGGGEVNGVFMALNLVDELLITVEPYVFGSGVDLFGGQVPSAKLELASMAKLNNQGTLLLRYLCRKM